MGWGVFLWDGTDFLQHNKLAVERKELQAQCNHPCPQRKQTGTMQPNTDATKSIQLAKQSNMGNATRVLPNTINLQCNETNTSRIANDIPRNTTNHFLQLFSPNPFENPCRKFDVIIAKYCKKSHGHAIHAMVRWECSLLIYQTFVERERFTEDLHALHHIFQN